MASVQSIDSLLSAMSLEPLDSLPTFLGALLDQHIDEATIRELLSALSPSCPVEPLLSEAESRNRLRLLRGWLEQRASEGSQNTALHTALAKIYVDTNTDPVSFLTNNQFYDAKTVGKYCEDRDPNLAVTVYKRAECDDELIEVTNKNGLYRIQARYLVERHSLDLWSKVLDPGNSYRQPLLNQVIATAVPDSKNADEVSTAVKAFMTAGLTTELIGLLERILLCNSDFSNNRNLQNLLILTAIKTDPSRVIGYVNRLSNYDASDLAKIAVEHYQLYEEGFAMYKKAGMNEEAVEVLITNLEDLGRAQQFAQEVNSPGVWGRLQK